MSAKKRVHNFNAGPATLPLAVLETIERELYNWKNTGMSVMEVSHRGEHFMAMATECEQNFRDLLNISDDYRVLFLPGGGRTQFAMVPMNFAHENGAAAYVDMGVWGELAINEARNFTNVNVVTTAKPNHYTSIPDQSTWADFSDASYLYYVDNETVNGLEFSYIPDSKHLPLISDMSSNILSREFDVNQFDLIFACAQKNLGISGITVAVIRKEMLEHEPMQKTPTMLRYQMHALESSLLNTPATFPWYVLNEILKWMKTEGGVSVMEARNKRKSQKLYDFIDASSLYQNPILARDRSRMNVVFFLKKPELEKIFFAEAEKANLLGIKGHRVMGGARVSLYNAVTEASVDALIEFMDEFAKRNS